MTVNISNQNGLRQIEFSLEEINGNLPQQAITHANLDHVKIAKQPDFDFGANFLELIEYKEKKFLEDSFYRKKQVKKFSKEIKNNPDKIFLFVINGSKTFLKFTRETNEILINFQIECGFKFIKAFIKSSGNAMEDYKYYRTIIPKKCKFVAQIDENINHNVFKKIYLDCYEKEHDELICFFGRKPSKVQQHNKFNFNFIQRRREDKIIRFSSSTAKANKGIASSFVYYYYGFDVFSILAGKWNPDMPKDLDLEALDGIDFKPLDKNTKLICPLRNESLYDSSIYFKEKYNRKSIPISVHTVYHLNHKLKDLHKIFSSANLKKILGDRIV